MLLPCSKTIADGYKPLPSFLLGRISKKRGLVLEVSI
jgi:hypothetical protein